MIEDLGSVEDLGAVSQVEDLGAVEDLGSVSEEPKNNWSFNATGIPVVEQLSDLGAEVQAGADLVLGLPAFFAKLGTRGAASTYFAIAGEQNPAQKADELVNNAIEGSTFNKLLARPLATAFGNEAVMEGTFINGLMSSVGESIQGSVSGLEDKESQALAMQSIDVLMGLAGSKSVAEAVSKGVSKVKAQAKQYTESKATKVSLDEILNEFDDIKVQEEAARPKPELKNQDELPFTNSIDDARAPEFTPLRDKQTPQQQDLFDFTNEAPQPRQPDLFEPEANAALMEKNANPISPRAIEEYKFQLKNQDYLDLSTGKTPSKGAVSRVADELIEELPYITDPKIAGIPLEKLSNKLSKTEWVKEFMLRNPGRTEEAANFAFSKLQPEKHYNVSLGKTIDGVSRAAFGTLFTRLGNVSPEILQGQMKYEFDILRRPKEIYNKIDPIFEEIATLPDDLVRQVDSALQGRDIPQLNRTLIKAGKGHLIKSVESEILNTVKSLGEEAKSLGVLKGLRDNYVIPAVVRDYKGLSKALGREINENALTQALEDAAKEAYKKGTRFGDLERTEVISKFLKGHPKPNSYKAPYRKERVFETIPEELKQFYYSPREALHMYVKNITEDIETAKFFGKGIKKDAEGKLLLDESITAKVNDLYLEGKLSPDKIAELERLYRARFQGGNRSPNPWIQGFKNISSGVLLNDLTSTAIQTMDIPQVAVLSQPHVVSGLQGTIKSLVSNVKKKADLRLSAKDLGLVDHYMNTEIQRYASDGSLGKKFANASAALADATFRVNLFRKADIAMKDIALNVHLEAAGIELSSMAGRRAFEKEWAPRFGNRYPQLLKDLRTNNMTPLVAEYAFSQLAKTQAISKGNWTVWSLENPNSRLFTTLKTFAINQLQLYRTEALRKIENGQVKDGVASLAKVSTALTLSNMGSEEVKNFILGRDDDSPALQRAGLAMLKSVGVTQPTMDELKQGNVGKAAIQYAAPPLTMFDRAISDALKDIQDDGSSLEESKKRYLDLLPYGRTINSQLLGGKDTWQNKYEEDRLKELADGF